MEQMGQETIRTESLADSRDERMWQYLEEKKGRSLTLEECTLTVEAMDWADCHPIMEQKEKETFSGK